MLFAMLIDLDYHIYLSQGMIQTIVPYLFFILKKYPHPLPGGASSFFKGNGISNLQVLEIKFIVKIKTITSLNPFICGQRQYLLDIKNQKNGKVIKYFKKFMSYMQLWHTTFQQVWLFLYLLSGNQSSGLLFIESMMFPWPHPYIFNILDILLFQNLLRES